MVWIAAIEIHNLGTIWKIKSRDFQLKIYREMAEMYFKTSENGIDINQIQNIKLNWRDD